MENKDLFRTAVLGGYQKEDVIDYVRSLENENETIRVLTKKENAGIKAQLEQEKAAGEEMRKTLADLQKQVQRLEAEKENWQNSVQFSPKDEQTVTSQDEREQHDQSQLKILKFGDLLEEMKKNNEKLEQRCETLEKYLDVFGKMLNERIPVISAMSEKESEQVAEEAKAQLDAAAAKIDEPQKQSLPLTEERSEQQLDSKDRESSDNNGDTLEEPEEMSTDMTVEGEMSEYEKKAQQSLQSTNEKIAKLLKSLGEISSSLDIR